LALSAQARLFVLFADGEYKGFCLLGECFSVYLGNVKHTPVSAELLRFELSKVQTRASSAKELSEAMNKLILTSGDAAMIDEEEALNPYEVADILAVVDLEKSSEVAITETQEALKKMAFRNEYKTYSPSAVSDSIDDLLLCERNLSTWKKLPFYIPIKNWSGIDDPVYQILARFGSTSFSFVATTKGTWISIPDKLASDPTIGVFAEQETTSNKVYFYDKPVDRAVRDWKELLNRGAIRYDADERAGSIKATSFTGASRMSIVRALISLRVAGVLGNNLGSGPVNTGSGPSKKPEVPKVDFDDEFIFDFPL
jgi:hypothetical protein